MQERHAAFDTDRLPASTSELHQPQPVAAGLLGLPNSVWMTFVTGQLVCIHVEHTIAPGYQHVVKSLMESLSAKQQREARWREN